MVTAKMLSPAGEGNLTDFCASLFRFQGAAARHRRTWTATEVAVQGQTEPTLVPVTADCSGFALAEHRGVRVNPPPKRSRKDWHPWAEAGLYGDGHVRSSRTNYSFARWDEPISDRARPRRARNASPQHLTKVGSKPDVATEGRHERGAMMDVMGLGNRSSGGKSVLFIIGVLIMVAAIVSLVVLSTISDRRSSSPRLAVSAPGLD